VRLGINVGDTNIHVVLMQGTAILAESQVTTMPGIVAGITEGLQAILDSTNVNPSRIETVTIGTAQFSKAFVERQNLTPVAVVRLGLPATRAIPPFADWPTDLQAVINGHAYLAHGGYEFDGRAISRLQPAEIREIAQQIHDQGIRAVAISSVFSMVNPSMEVEAAEIIRQTMPEATITLSHEIGRMGLLERENAAIMNACLCDQAKRVIQTFRTALAKMRVQAPLYLSQNDGTSMSASYAERYPVLTFASTSSNAICGAAFLSGAREAVVIDMGGRTSKVGVLVRGFPLESVFAVYLGGVRVNLRMPDLFTFNLGTGSLISLEPLRIGPESVGPDLTKRSITFGGSDLTALDIAVAAGIARVGHHSAVNGIPAHQIERAMREMHRLVEQAVRRMKVTATPVLVILVGSGSILISPRLSGASDVIRPDYFAMARAVGAAIGRVGGEVDRVFSLNRISREAALQQAREAACAKAAAAGAKPGTIQVVDEQVTPLNYLRGNAVRVRIRSIGDPG
jgi:N-methylhydantoinase A/oxoprolinase/acetone carboxylase beta subunit